MKILYYLTKLLSLPFYTVAAIFHGIGSLFGWLGDLIHDLTEYPAWLVLHRRACAKMEDEPHD